MCLYWTRFRTISLIIVIFRIPREPFPQNPDCGRFEQPYTKVCKPTYRGQTKLRVDEPERAELPSGGQPGWSLDKDKFLSMFEHAQKNFPRLKWTVYIEDITFVFWKNTLSAEK
ncbi:hypothetical protein sscle_05g044440 [Sclerotinia sclerotiorum 1980 UF-70]|uniref:Uncharacterized protein n=1 Tax=Sclerotinia sclerotiorum (strain ATCC 18683 / 1980 / Ss-1) TaxID=665079 RepID=A0A1D9Q3Z8_SCLS1|nr:hypothetical protein sscle_05g044440 [Sclerotinia sclerotiorum 1980 UF-70]